MNNDEFDANYVYRHGIGDDESPARHSSLIDLNKMNYPADCLLTEDSLEHLSFLVLEDHFCQMPKGEVRNQFPFKRKGKWRTLSSWIKQKRVKFQKCLPLRWRMHNNKGY